MAHLIILNFAGACLDCVGKKICLQMGWLDSCFRSGPTYRNDGGRVWLQWAPARGPERWNIKARGQKPGVRS